MARLFDQSNNHVDDEIQSLRPSLFLRCNQRVRLPERNSLTIAAGFHCAEGLLLCADTQITFPGVMKQGASKIVPIDFVSNGGSKALFAITGDIFYAHMAIEHCRRALAKIEPKHMTNENITIVIEDTLQIFFQDHVFNHPSFISGSIAVQMLIGVWSHIAQKVTLLATRETAVTIVRDYECLGAGLFLARYLLPTMFRHPRMPVSNAVHIALHVLRETKDHVDSCGGASEILILGKDGNFSFADSIDLRCGEMMSEAFSEAIRRLFVCSADLNTTEEQLKTEFDMALGIVQGQRKRLSAEYENEENGADSMAAVKKYWLDAKVIKS